MAAKPRKIGAAIVARREALGMTQTKLAAAADHMATTTLREFEEDSDRPHSPTTEFKLARALGWPPDAFARLRRGADPDDFEAAAPAGNADLAAVLGKLTEVADGAAVLLARLEAVESRLLQVERRLHG